MSYKSELLGTKSLVHAINSKGGQKFKSVVRTTIGTKLEGEVRSGEGGNGRGTVRVWS